MNVLKTEVFGLMKTMVDAHTMGIYAAAGLLKDCGYNVIISPPRVEKALETLESEESKDIVLKWIDKNHINHIGISYRLDPQDAIEIVGRLVVLLKENGYFEAYGACVKSIYFAGLKRACDVIDIEYHGRIHTFRGGESAEESLTVMGVPKEEIPHYMIEGCKYDNQILAFADDVITKGEYKHYTPLVRNTYDTFGGEHDSLIQRLDHNFKDGFEPLVRAHSGPYSPDLTRQENIKQYKEWCQQLAAAGYLDILSIGSSQLSQSYFGENWSGRMNGGGVPVNSENEYIDIWKSANPMLVRTYSATRHVRQMAEMYERTIHIAWHALSLWWFDELDGRGPNSLYANLKEHIETMKYIASVNTPVEANVPHHFAFRGCDDVTYIVAEYLAAKMAKKCGNQYFILQNMLNTPRSTWGVQDLAKSRTVLKLVKELEDSHFRVIFQTRAGLDYFKPDLEQAKVQLAAVTAMMDDIDPYNHYNPQIIHVVSYSEALFLATPDVLNESICITRNALSEYRTKKRELGILDKVSDEIATRMERLETDARQLITAMEKNIQDLYSPEGLYIAFVAGWLPVPELWSDSSEFFHAKNWKTKLSNGGIMLTEKEIAVPVETRINRCIGNIPDASYLLKSKYGWRK